MRKPFGLFRALAFLALLFCCIPLMAGGPPPSTTDTVPLQLIPSGATTGCGGESHLTRTDDSLFIVVESCDLVPGDAYTLWWVVFNDPTECASHPCTGFDFGNSLVGGSVGNASGNIAKSDGTMEFGGALRQDAGEDGHEILFGDMLTADPHDAEVHIVVQSHGQGRGGEKLRQQLTYFEANCTPVCADLQFAIHQP